MEKYTLTSEEQANFLSDEARGLIRERLSHLYPEGVLVVDDSDKLLDVLQPVNISDNVEPAVMLTEEEREEREQKRLLEQQEIEHYESEIKPKVIDKIRADVRKEFRDQLKDMTNEKLQLKGQVAKLERESATALNKAKTDLVFMTAERDRLKLESEKNIKLISDAQLSMKKLYQDNTATSESYIAKIRTLEKALKEAGVESPVSDSVAVSDSGASQ